MKEGSEFAYLLKVLFYSSVLILFLPSGTNQDGAGFTPLQEMTYVFSINYSTGECHGRHGPVCGVASFGVLRFDGAGNVEADLRVNAAVDEGGRSRTTRFVTGRGTYMVAETASVLSNSGSKVYRSPAISTIS